MPRTAAANQHVRETQRAKILDAARKVFALKGTAATMSDIAAAAEISQGLAYRYFASKEALFHELVTQTAESGVANVQRVMDMPGTPGERLEFLLHVLFGNRPEIHEHYQLSFRTLNDEATPDVLRDLLRRQGQTLQDVLRQLIVEAQASGEVLAGDPDQLVIAVIACFEGVSRLALRRSERVEQHFPDASIILRMLKA